MGKSVCRSLSFLFSTLVFLLNSSCSNLFSSEHDKSNSVNNSTIKFRLQGSDSSSKVSLKEGNSILFLIFLESPCSEICMFNYTLTSSNGEVGADYWIKPSLTFNINPGESTGGIFLETKDNQIFNGTTEWTLKVQFGSSAVSESMAILLEDNDPNPNIITSNTNTSPPSANFDVSSCTGGASFYSSSKDQPSGEFLVAVDSTLINCRYKITVKGAGGGAVNANSAGGSGGLNEFYFYPKQTGTLRIVVGQAGAMTPGDDGAPGGGASSVLFDPDVVPTPTDAFGLSIAGGGGGAGSGKGGHGGGIFSGADGSGDGKGAPGNGIGGSSIDAVGGTCFGYCQGGAGGSTYDSVNSIWVSGGFGKGSGAGGGNSTYGGGGGGGFGGGGASRWAGGAGGGAGKIFYPILPSKITDITVGNGLGNGGKGGLVGSVTPEDGSVILLISPP